VGDLTKAFNNDTVYNTMIVGVEEDSSIYVLTNKNSWTNPLAWKKLASTEVVEGLSNVFQFKGGAEFVNADFTTLTTKSFTLEDQTIYAQKTACDYIGEIYVGWGPSNDSILFWTDEPTLTSNSRQYTKADSEETVNYIIYNGAIYYATDTPTIYETISGT
jgi:hypothetical protein